MYSIHIFYTFYSMYPYIVYIAPHSDISINNNNLKEIEYQNLICNVR